MTVSLQEAYKGKKTEIEFQDTQVAMLAMQQVVQTRLVQAHALHVMAMVK